MARSLLLIGVVIWGWTFVATKVCLDHMEPFELLGLRFLIALPVLLILIRVKGIRMAPGSHLRRLLLGSAVLMVHFLVQITGLKFTSATNTGWIIAVTPLLITLLSWGILAERIGRRTLVGVIVATAGILLLVSSGENGGLGWLGSAGDWLVLASAHTWALYTILTRDVARARDPLDVTFCALLPATLVVLAIMLVRSDWREFTQLPTEAIVAILFLGIPGTALGHWFWQEGVARIGAAKAGMFLYLEPVATTALAVPYLGESFGAATLTGGALVLLGVWLSQRGG